MPKDPQPTGPDQSKLVSKSTPVPADPLSLPDKDEIPMCDCGMPDGMHSAGCSTRKMASPIPSRDHLDSVSRYDSINMPSWMTKSFKLTPEGFLKGRAIVTSIGVFQYKNPDGTLRGELRLPEEVFEEESLDSMKLKPLTNGHPTEQVTSENIAKYQIGNLGDNPSKNTQWSSAPGWDDTCITDGLHVAIDLTVQNADGISAVRNGKVALSMGYSCNLDPVPEGARYLGTPYQYIQRRIRYNHIALVEEARAGDAARITFDRLDSSESLTQDIEKNTKQEDLMLKTINLDGVDYQAEAKVLEFLSKEKMRADAAEGQVTALTTQKSTLEGERDAQKDRADKLDAELAKVKADAQDQTKLDSAIQAKLELYQTVTGLGVEIKKDGLYLSDLDIKKAVILKASPEAKLDGKDDAYIQGRFDSALEGIKVTTANNTTISNLTGGAEAVDLSRKDGEDKPTSVDARAEMIKRQQSGWKGETK